MRPPHPERAKAAKGRLSPEDYDLLLKNFESPIAALDCGRFCAPLNGGAPVCCTTENAVPVLDRAEWELLRARTDLWARFRPKDAAGRAIVKEAGTLCVAAECKGAAFCERENRSLACRAFPFAPYIDKKGDFVGASYYWGFADRCWVISNLHVATPRYLREFFAAYDRLFLKDRDEWRANRDNSRQMRRVHSRRKQRFAMVGRDLRWRWVRPNGAGTIPIRDPARALKRFGPYVGEKAYRKAVRDAEGAVSEKTVRDAFSARPQPAPPAKPEPPPKTQAHAPRSENRDKKPRTKKHRAA